VVSALRSFLAEAYDQLKRGCNMKRVAIYLRVSTSKQDTDNQRRELEAVAARSGWHVERVYEDAGISGAKGRDKRPGLDAMLKAVNAKEFDMVAASGPPFPTARREC
jgi:predicted site-specific integrase-resolvase